MITFFYLQENNQESCTEFIFKLSKMGNLDLNKVNYRNSRPRYFQ